MDVPPERWAQSEAWLLAGHLGMRGRHRARDPLPAEWRKPPSISGTRRLGSGGLTSGGQPEGCWHQAASCPHLMRPVTPRQTPGHQRPQGPQVRLPPGPEERDIPAGCVSGGPPPQSCRCAPTREDQREPAGGAPKGHFPGVTENTNRLGGSHSNASHTGLKTLTWTHMLELIDPDPYPFSKCSWSSCYLPGSVLGI